MKNKRLLIYTDVYERFHFFVKYLTPLQALGYEPWIITARHSIALAARKHTPNVLTLTHNTDEISACPKINYAESLNVLNRYHTVQEAVTIGQETWSTLTMFYRQLPFDMIWIWNGTTTIAMTLSRFAQHHHIATRFFEISNLPKRVFVDIKGTSGASCLAQHPELLDAYSADEKAYQAWLETYHQDDLLPQQAANRSKIPWSAFIDILGYLRGYIREDKRCVFTLLLNRLSNRFFDQTFPEVEIQTPYIFLPLQVSDDSQLKLFSHYSNLDLLVEALKIGQEKGIQVIVKIHPAESNRDEIQKIIQHSSNNAFVIAANPTKELIRNAKLVIVNNSTVGLQALIEEKEVMVFGNAFYRDFDQARLKTYILHYLLPGDYFGEEEIPHSSVASILKRNLWQAPVPNKKEF